MTSPIKVWREQKKIKNYLGLKGKIISFSLVRVPPTGFMNLAPYYVAVCEMETSHQKLIGQVVEAFEDLKIGQKVEVVYRKMAEVDKAEVINYGLKFKPI